MATYRSLKYHDELVKWLTYSDIAATVIYFALIKLTSVERDHLSPLVVLGTVVLTVRGLTHIAWAVWFWRAASNLRHHFGETAPPEWFAPCFLGFNFIKLLLWIRVVIDYFFGWPFTPASNLFFYIGLVFIYSNMFLAPFLLWRIHAISAELVKMPRSIASHLWVYAVVFAFFNLIGFNLREEHFVAVAVAFGAVASWTVKMIVHDVRRWQGKAAGASGDVNAAAPMFTKHRTLTLGLLVLGMVAVFAFGSTLDYLNMQERSHQSLFDKVQR